MGNSKTVYAQGLELMRRPLEIHEIEFRVQSVKDKGAIVLAYKTARTDMNRLDESGLNWKNDYESIDGKLFCEISIHNPELNQWIGKCDTGTESNTEAQKGEASDAFKRAGFRWGIGRELYDFPFIWINKKGENDKFYDIRDWTWGMRMEEDQLVQLSAKDKTGDLRYNWKATPPTTKPERKITTEETKKSSEKIEKSIDVSHLTYTIGLAKTKQQVMDMVERAGIDPLSNKQLATAIQQKLTQFA